MAEFIDVMKQAKRMCKTHESCWECPMPRNNKEYSCPLCAVNGETGEIEKVERIVMDWAAENPEPRYPSWKKWWDDTFSDSAYMPCPKNFMSNEASGCIEQPNCPDCMNRPIPADIAEKLGVKPIGGESE